MTTVTAAAGYPPTTNAHSNPTTLTWGAIAASGWKLAAVDSGFYHYASPDVDGVLILEYADCQAELAEDWGKITWAIYRTDDGVVARWDNWQG